VELGPRLLAVPGPLMEDEAGFASGQVSRFSAQSPAVCGSTSSSEMGTSIVLGATLAPSQASNENVILAMPLPASSGTRTGPWNSAPQQTLSSG